MATTFEKILLVGTYDAYSRIESKDANKLYFTSDTRQLFKGADLYTEALRVVSTRPSTPAQGVIYQVGGKTLEMYDGTKWVVLVPEIVSTVTDTEAAIPNSKAVKTYVDTAISNLTKGGDVVQKVVAGTDAASLNVTTGGKEAKVTIPGVVTTPSYDATTRTITLPTSTGEPVVIALGKDVFVDPNADNKYNPETKNIELYLNDSTGNPTKIEIPAAGLVDTYTGGATATATVTVSDKNVITANVKISSDAKNALTTDGQNGLILDLTDVNTAIAEAKSAAQAAQKDATKALADAKTANDAIAILNGTESTPGSVSKAVKDLNIDLSAKITAAQETANTAVANAAAAQTAADNAQAAVDGVIAGIGWGTF